MKVWVCEHGDYEQRGVWLVASSVAEGVRVIKEMFGPPYIVEWEPLHDSSLIGHFANVPGHSVGHVGRFDFTEYELDVWPHGD